MSYMTRFLWAWPVKLWNVSWWHLIILYYIENKSTSVNLNRNKNMKIPSQRLLTINRELKTQASSKIIGMNDDLGCVIQTKKLPRKLKPDYIIQRNIKSASRSRRAKQSLLKKPTDNFKSNFGVRRKFITKRVW